MRYWWILQTWKNLQFLILFIDLHMDFNICLGCVFNRKSWISAHIFFFKKSNWFIDVLQINIAIKAQHTKEFSFIFSNFIDFQNC